MPPMMVRGYLAALPHIIRQRNEDLLFKVYVTDSLQLQGEGKYLTKRWAGLIEQKKQDNRTADEVVMDIVKNAGLKIGKQGGETE